MTALVDTSVVVRYLVDDVPEQARRAAEILDHERGLQVSSLVVVETACVLTSVYGIARDVAVDHLVALLQKENLDAADIDKGLMLEALLLCRPSHRISFADAFLWATARHGGIPRIVTFDRRFPDDGVELVS